MKGEEVKLRECPFCGGPGKLVEVLGEYFVECPTGCLRMSGNREACVDRWNQRPAKQPVFEGVERARYSIAAEMSVIEIFHEQLQDRKRYRVIIQEEE